CLRAKGVVVEKGHSLGRVHQPGIPFRVKAPYDALVRALRSSARQSPLKLVPQHHHRDVGIISAPLPLRIAIPYPSRICRPMTNPRNVGHPVRIRRGIRRDTAQRRASPTAPPPMVREYEGRFPLAGTAAQFPVVPSQQCPVSPSQGVAKGPPCGTKNEFTVTSGTPAVAGMDPASASSTAANAKSHFHL